jgi:hypothetical protein
LNYCYIVEAGRLAKALAAQGLCLSIGFLHSDKKGRNSLVWDAIEPLRPLIDAKVFAFIAAHEFARRDFPQSGYNVYRLSREVTQLLLHKCSLPAPEIEEAAEWMIKAILDCQAYDKGVRKPAVQRFNGSTTLPIKDASIPILQYILGAGTSGEDRAFLKATSS